MSSIFHVINIRAILRYLMSAKLVPQSTTTIILKSILLVRVRGHDTVGGVGLPVAHCLSATVHHRVLVRLVQFHLVQELGLAHSVAQGLPDVDGHVLRGARLE